MWEGGTMRPQTRLMCVSRRAAFWLPARQYSRMQGARGNSKGLQLNLQLLRRAGMPGLPASLIEGAPASCGARIGPGSEQVTARLGQGGVKLYA